MHGIFGRLEPNFYAASGLDRVAHLRADEGWLRAQLVASQTRIVPVWRSKNLVTADDDGNPSSEPLFLLASETRVHVEAALGDGLETIVLLGLADGIAHFALDLSHLEESDDLPSLAGPGVFADLRAVGPQMPRPLGAILAYARGILTWHRRHLFCGRCGNPTESSDAGHIRRCTNPNCAMTHFPRTDPAVIMLVTRGEQCLMGRQKVWMPGMYSTLAGFVEPGETLEEAVAREVFEETGIRVTDVRYNSSQPWPFPTSLMLGFHATALDSEIKLAEDELEDAQWFSRDFIRGHEPNETFRTPRRDSIAWRLIRDWLDGG